MNTGDFVRHNDSGQTGVVVERLGKNRIVVSLDSRKATVVWYTSRARVA